LYFIKEIENVSAVLCAVIKHLGICQNTRKVFSTLLSCSDKSPRALNLHTARGSVFYFCNTVVSLFALGHYTKLAESEVSVFTAASKREKIAYEKDESNEKHFRRVVPLKFQAP
jgi:hypothetical protein